MQEFAKMSYFHLYLSTLFLVITVSSSATTGTCQYFSKETKEKDFKISCKRGPNALAIKLECFNSHSSPWSYLKDFSQNRLNLTNINVTITKCMLLPDISIFNLTQLMGITQLNSIELENTSQLNRFNLKDLSVKSLKIINSYIEELPADLLYDTHMDNLVINAPMLKEIPNQFFKRSTQLEILEIINTKIVSLNQKNFSGLKYLQELLLFGNFIQNIEPGTFDDLPNLSTLDLSNNNLKRLSSELFKKLVNLTVLNLTENEFDYLPTDLLNVENSSLAKFRMNYNRGTLETLPDFFFHDLSNLKYVSLICNQFKRMAENVFTGANSLSIINLTNNSLTQLPVDLFKSTNKLKEIHLGHNKLNDLPSGIFDETNVEKIFIQHNNLHTLSEGVMDGLNRVVTFDASHNNIEHIVPEFCKENEYMENVETIDLSFNKLTLEKPAFNRCVRLKHLILAQNNIRHIFFEWAVLGNLIEIDLAANKITSINALDLQVLTNKSKLNLTNNQITTVDFSDLNKTLLQYFRKEDVSVEKAMIDLSENPFHCDCQLLDMVHYLQKTRFDTDVYQVFKMENKDQMKCNSPPELKDALIRRLNTDDLRCLKKNYCNDNCTCWDYPAKETLLVDCSFQNLSVLPENVKNIDKRYIALNLSNNKFNEAPDLEALPMNLTSLDLSSNNITFLNLDLSKLSLKQLKLHDNKINRLQPTMISQLSKNTQLENLTLHGNPWVCDCEARYFLKMVQRKLNIIVAGVVCKNSGKHISVLTTNELCYNVIIMSLAIAICGVVLGASLAVYFKYQKHIKIWLYAKGCCLWFVKEDELDKDKEYDAFISYSHKDEDFVFREIVSKLEEGPSQYKLCLHCRDWVAGEYIPAQIIHSVEQSRRTVVVLTPNFLESIWGRMEFRTAHSQALRERRSRVIVILYGDIGDLNNLDSELKAYLAMNTYVKWGDPWFWNKLRYALPHRNKRYINRRWSSNAERIADYLENQEHEQTNVSASNEKDRIPLSKITDATRLLDSLKDDETLQTTNST